MTTYTLVEWGSLRFGDGDQQMPRVHAMRLASIAASSPLAGPSGNDVLTLGYDRLHAHQVVGVVADAACSLEILPKIEGLVERQLRQQLVHMLAIAYDLPVDSARLASLSRQNTTLLELIIRLFAELLANTARAGIPRSYVELEDDQTTLRGRLNVIRQYTTLTASPARLACRFDEFSPDTPLNQIIKAAIDALIRLSRTIDTRRQLTELAFAYEGVSLIATESLPWREVKIDRTNQRWASLLEFARLLLAQQYQTTSLGQSTGYALLFEMNTLFERYIERLLKKALRPLGYAVSGQSGGLYCLTGLENGSPAFRTRPDIVVRYGAKVAMILDTKWKHAGGRDDSKHGITQSDVYQMMAYSQLYACERLVLLYPYSNKVSENEGVFCRYRIGSGPAELSGMAIDVSQQQQIELRLAANLTQLLATL